LYSIAIEQPEFRMDPLTTPSLPAEAFALAVSHQMPPNLLRYPVFDKRKDQVECPTAASSKAWRDAVPERPRPRRTISSTFLASRKVISFESGAFA
jgi:hypothetical protein